MTPESQSETETTQDVGKTAGEPVRTMGSRQQSSLCGKSPRMAEGPAENNKPSAEMGEQTAVQGSMKPLQNNEMEEHRKTPPQTETQTTHSGYLIV